MYLDQFKQSKCYKYAEDVIDGNVISPLYIKKVCEVFIWEIDNQDEMEYFFDLKEANRILKIMKLINFATGSVAGESLFNVCVGYQYFFILNLFCWKRKDNPKKRRYEVILLWIARKNSKSVNASLIMIILMLTEPQYSEFYLASNTRDQAKIVFNETKKLIESSPLINKHFVIKRDVIECKINKSELRALSSDYNTTDGLRVSAACIDEVGAAKDSGLIESMTSGMLSVENRLLILISTSYPNQQNPFLEWVEYSKKVIDKVVDDPKLFAMLYSLDDGDEMIPENFLKANPLQAALPEGMEYLTTEYNKALEMGSGKLTSFKTKHLNIWLDGDLSEVYISTDDLKKCCVEDIDWKGMEVFLGIDLAMTTDNCSVAMVGHKNDTVYMKSWAFIPADKIREKTRMEKVDYENHIRQKNCFACGDTIIDYAYIEKFIMDIQRKYKVKVVSIGFDRYNCISTAQKLEEAGYEMVEIKQHSSVLHSPTKLLEELVLTKTIEYEQNQLLEINFSNARCVYNSNLNRYVNKKKSTGKIDMVAATLNALCLLEKELLSNSFVVQVF